MNGTTAHSFTSPLPWLGVAVVLLPCASAFSQTTSAPGIDLEIYDPSDGDNVFCIAPGESFWANAYMRPGDQAITCSPPCSPPDVLGGSANIATGVIDVAFDPTVLARLEAETNPDPGFAAVDGLIQAQNLAEGRIGWALSGDWNVDGDPASDAKSPCDMLKLDAEGWVFRMRFEGQEPGLTTLRLRRESDPSGFVLSFADVCGSESFTEESGALDEIGHAVVLVDSDCGSVLFFDNLERGDTSLWSFTTGS